LLRIAFKINSAERLLRSAPAIAATAAASQDPVTNTVSNTPAQSLQVKPQGMGIGVFSWWRDSSAAAVGIDMGVTVSNPSITTCLQSCNDASECAAVVLQFDASGGVSSCSLRRGDVAVGGSMWTLVRTRTLQVDAV
jgi:hypothetical protein